jgi:hypothetical protein
LQLQLSAVDTDIDTAIRATPAWREKEERLTPLQRSAQRSPAP